MNSIVPQEFDIISKIWRDPKIRWVFVNGNVYLSIADGVQKYARITNHKTGEVRERTDKEAAAYWNQTLKKVLKSEGFQHMDAIHKFKLLARDGKRHPTDCTDPITFLRIIDSIRDPSLEPFRMAIARVLAKPLAIAIHDFREVTEGRGWAADEIRYLHEINYLPTYHHDDAFTDMGYHH